MQISFVNTDSNGLLVFISLFSRTFIRNTYTDKHANTHTHIHTHTYTNAHTHTHIHMHTHTQTPTDTKVL
jgi:hypothetical protein